MGFFQNFFNRDCRWSHDWPLWGEPFERGWKKYNDDTVYTRFYQRRTCARCSKVAEQQVGTVY